MRAYRPGLVGDRQYDEEFQSTREDKVRLYTQRAQEGLPLFDPPVVPVLPPKHFLIEEAEGDEILRPTG